MGGESIQLSQVILGMEPYILIRIMDDIEGDEENVYTELEFGGGFPSATAAIEFLKAVIESAEEN